MKDYEKQLSVSLGDDAHDTGVSPVVNREAVLQALDHVSQTMDVLADVVNRLKQHLEAAEKQQKSGKVADQAAPPPQFSIPRKFNYH